MLTSASQTCCASHCSICLITPYSNVGGHGKSPVRQITRFAPTIVAPMVTQQIFCIPHSPSTPSTQKTTRCSEQRVQECIGFHSISFPFNWCFVFTKYHVSLHHKHARIRYIEIHCDLWNIKCTWLGDGATQPIVAKSAPLY